METKIKYTDSGKKEIALFQEEQKSLLEKYLIREKYVMGDDEIEVTGSDIIRLKNRIDINYRSSKPFKSSSLKLASYLYVILGIGITLFGFTYEYLKELLESNREQAMMVIVGITITILGVFLSVFLKLKEKRQKEYEMKKKLMDELTGHNNV